MKSICVVTGSRAEYGLLRWVIEGIEQSLVLNLQLIATGTHLSPEFGSTYLDIVADGFVIDRKLEMLLSSDTSVGTTKSMGLAVCGFADAFNELKPDLVLVLGDRFEIFSACSAAMLSRIPIAHLHGGETTEGAFDEAIRHAITKMSHLHFVAATEFERRVIRMGENPERVYKVGGLGVDAIKKTELLTRQELEESLNFTFGERNLLITFHPVTLEPGTASGQMQELISALDSLENTHFIFTLPNADTESRLMIDVVNQYCENNPDSAIVFKSMGVKRYYSALACVDGVVGNSSSGLAEAPSFSIGTVNVGNRQRGRLKATSVIDCAANKDAIGSAIAKLYSPDFKATLKHTVNPYGEGGASEKIVCLLEQLNLENILVKQFYDEKFL